ncbi:MAG: VOC family protein, partial [Oscillospiraceae bacterium]
KANDLYCNSAGLRTYFLSFDSGARLELMYHPSCEKRGTSPLSHGLTHLSFAVGSREKVDELTSQIAADGYEILRRPRVTGDGYYESVVLDNDGNQIEITV